MNMIDYVVVAMRKTNTNDIDKMTHFCDITMCVILCLNNIAKGKCQPFLRHVDHQIPLVLTFVG